MMAKGMGYEMAVGAAELHATKSNRRDIVVLCPLCGGQMEYEPMADSWFCYSAETNQGVEFCPAFSNGEPSYDDSRQNLILAHQADAACRAIRGRNGKTNIKVEGNPNDSEWLPVA